MTNQDNVKKVAIPHSKPTLGPEEIKAVSEVIESGYVAEGQRVANFERAFEKFLGVDFAVSTSSGTSALHLTLLALGVKPGDEVILPSYVCSALLNAVNYTGATPILAEISPDTYNLDAADLKKRLSRRSKAIIVPHLFGMAADLEPILALDVPIIEDCAQAVGTTYRGRLVGTFGEAAVFSFYATKVMTTGEGGMVVSKSKKIAEWIRNLKSYDRKENYKIRFNYKMTDIQAALGLVQLGRLEYIIKRRQEIAQKYSKAFSGYNLKLPPSEYGHIYFRYVLGLHNNSAPWIQDLARMGIACERPIYLPLHRHMNLEGYPVTEKVWQNCISIPIYPLLSDENIDRVIDVVTACHKKFS